ncbi:MAG: CmcJ/NvfI family oxidoreductase [Pseudomonadota bacterium]
MQDTALVNYHIRSAAPQAFRFDVDGVVGKLESPELAPTRVPVRDLRGSTICLDFDRDGITFERHETRTSGIGRSSGWEDAYNEELRALLTDRIGASDVIVFDHTVRVDDADAARKPARNVHNDYSATGANQRLVDLLGRERASEFEDGHYGFVNVWRPIEHPIESSPLGFIHPQSVKPEDWITIELIYPERIGQILGVVASADHDWFYLSQMTPNDVAVFNIFDNRGRPFLGHSALDMENTTASSAPRKSIESRTLVRYG